MNFRDLDLKTSYINQGEEAMANSLIIPALKRAKLYQRSVGYFSSGALDIILDGIAALHRNGGHVQLIASPHLEEQDIAAINLGYEERSKVVSGSFSRTFLEELEKLSDTRLQLLSQLVAAGTLDFKIAVAKSNGDYHDKLGILEDQDGNTIVFFGSPNSSKNGYQDNYEKIRVVKSWALSDLSSIEDEKNEFRSLWENTNPFVDVYNYQETAQHNIIKVIENRKSHSKHLAVTLYDYQEEARDAWIKNNYHGFFVMATGTGKTWTAIASAKELLKTHPSTIVICAPYKHLIKQWAEDLVKEFPDSAMILVSSENPHWESEITDAIIGNKYNPKQIIILSTIVSFGKDRFWDTLSKDPSEKLLIVDEAHRFTSRDESLKTKFQYMLGLSATPFSGTSSASGKELMNFFGGEVYSLPIEDALKRNCLVGYYYHPIFVYATDEEDKKFRSFSSQIPWCFRNNVCINPDKLTSLLRSRLRVISMAEEKRLRFSDIIDHLGVKNHFIVYCGDGKLFDKDANGEIRHLQSVKNDLTKKGYKASQFTCTENMYERMELVEEFNKGNIDTLVAIRCLDEGINIPSITDALILSSNDDYREFVQRRGRILRKYPGKETANIYDVVVLPASAENTAWAKIELRRYHEYAKLALNNTELEAKLTSLLPAYDLTMEDIDVYDYEEEDEIDE